MPMFTACACSLIVMRVIVVYLVVQWWCICGEIVSVCVVEVKLFVCDYISFLWNENTVLVIY